MKSSIISLFLILSFLITSLPSVQAQTTNANAELIQKLLAQIVILQQELNKLIAAQGGSTTSTPACTFTRTLREGTQGTDVTCLQNYLKKKGHFSGTATGFYGPLTKAAVYKWQQQNGIVPEPTAIGMFGPRSQDILIKEMKAIPTVATNTNTDTVPKTETKKRGGGSVRSVSNGTKVTKLEAEKVNISTSTSAKPGVTPPVPTTTGVATAPVTNPIVAPKSVQTVTPPPPVATGNAQSFVTQVQNIGEGKWGTIVADNIADTVNPEKDKTANPRYPGTATFAGNGFNGKWQAWNSGVFAPKLGSCGSVLYYGGGHNDYWGNDITALNLCGGKSGGPLWQRLNNPYAGAFTWPLPNGMYPDGTPSPQHNYDGLAFDPVNNAMTVLTSMTSGPASTQVQTLWYFDVVAKQWRGPYPHKGAYHGQSTYDSKRGLIWFQPEQGSTVNANGELTSFNVKTGALAYYGWPYMWGVGALDSMMGYDPVRDRLVLTSFRVSGTVAERDPANPTVGWKIIPQKNKPAKVWGQNTMAWSTLRQAWIIWNSYEGGTVYELKFTGTNTNPEYTWTILTSGSNTIQPISPATSHNGPYEKFQIVSPSAGVEVLVGQLRLQDGIFAFRIPGPGTVIVPANDTTPPIVTASNATQNLSAGTKTATLSISTNESATCKYGTSANTAYTSLPTTFSTTGGTTHSIAVSGLTDGSTKTYVVRCIDGSGNANTSDTVLTIIVGISSQATTQTPAQTGLSFTQKCAQAGVLKCYKFTDQTSVNAVYQQSYAKKAAVYDTTMAAAKLFIPSESAADTSGTFLFNHPVVQKGVSGNDQYWMQYRVYIPQDFLEYKFPETSWKVFVAYHVASCSGNEFTQTNGYLRGFPQYYETCGANSVNEVSPNGVVGQYDLQPGGDTVCLYSTASVTGKPCFRYKGNTWTTYTVHLDLTARKAEVWAQNDGEALVKIIDWKLTTTEMISSIYFGPYMTRKDATKVHPEFNMYYQNIIISKNPISMGGGSLTRIPSKAPFTNAEIKSIREDLLTQLKSLQAELNKLK